MRTETSTPKNRTTDVIIPAPSPQTAWRISRVLPLPGYRLAIWFNDGVSGSVDLSRLIGSADAGVFAALRDPARFAQVYLEFGAVSWPGEVDLAPDAMYAAIKEHGEWIVSAAS
jgi:hypothetical protein